MTRAVLPLLLVALLGLGGCLSYPDTRERLDDDIVMTNYDPSASFGTYTTFNIRPDVPLVDGSEAPRLVDETTASALIDAVARNLAARGYVRVEANTAADLGVEISITTEVNTQRVCYSYGYYRGYGSPYWGYSGYSYYAPWGCSTSAWTSGTLVVDLVDLRAAASSPGTADAPASLKTIWTGASYRVLSTTAPENLGRAEGGIDQAFLQSPYLRAGGDGR